jgi:hypothetical protein
MKSKPKRHHLDRRAHALAAQAVTNNPEELMDTRAVAEWLSVSTVWLEIGRSRGYGPRFTHLSARVIRYRRGDVLKWLKARTHASTSEYDHRAAAAR